jgi:tetratricopeptide (TPR) repeat protein
MTLYDAGAPRRPGDFTRQGDARPRELQTARRALAIAATLLLAACHGATSGNGPLGAPFLDRSGMLEGRDSVTIPLGAGGDRGGWVRVDQRDTDLVLELRTADGRRLSRAAGPADRFGYEHVDLPPGAVPLVLEVRARSRPARTAGFRVQAFRFPPDLETRVRDALRSLAAADRVQADASGDGWTQAVDDASLAARRRALSAAEVELARARSPFVADAALARAGLELLQASKTADALAAADRARAAYQRGGDLLAGADAAVLAGRAALDWMREARGVDAANFEAAFATARRDFDAARAVYVAQGRPVGAAMSDLFLGTVYLLRYDLGNATALWERADRQLVAAGAASERTRVLAELATGRAERGDYRGAAAEFGRLLPMLAPARDDTYAMALLNSGAVLLFLGDTERALERYVAAANLAGPLNDPRILGFAQLGLGICHLRLGQADVATEHLVGALSRLPGDSTQRVVGFVRLAEARRRLADPAGAGRALDEADRLAARVGAPALAARVAVARAEDDLDDGHYDRALDHFDAALALTLPPSHPMIVRALVGRARAARLGAADRRPMLARAGRDLDRAMDLAETSGDPAQIVAVTAERAELAALMGRTEQSLELATRAVDGIRDLASTIGDPDARVTLTARLRDAIELKVALEARAALAHAVRGERAAAERAAANALAAADETNRLVAAPAAAAPRAERERLLDELAQRRLRLQALIDRTPAPAAAIAAVQAEIAVLRSRLTQAAGPATPAARSPVLSAAELRERVPKDAVVVVYSVGRRNSWRWEIARDRFVLTELPPAAALDRRVEAVLRAVRALDVPDAARSAARALAADLLPRTENPLPARRFVVPDGSLSAVPWGLLSLDDEAVPTVQLPSVAALAAGPSRAADARAWTRVALFADPVFDAADPRVAAADGRRASAIDGRPLARLPGTAREAMAIAALAGTARVVLGADATRAALLSLPAGGFDVLHLATHATFEPSAPMLSAIVLSRRDAAGHALPAELRADDVLRWHRVPPLVVLSACDAAAEPSRAAPGLMNLTRAFLSAGADYVVASRWAVSDASAVALMTEFYRELLNEHRPPDAALAAAQRTLARSERWRAPFHWAGFVVTGRVP